MEVGINPVTQEADVTKFVFPRGPCKGSNNWDMRDAVTTGRVSPLRLIKTSHDGDDDTDDDVDPP